MLNWKNKLKMKKKIGCLERSVKNSKLTKIIIKIKKLLKKMDWMIIMTLIINKIKVFNYNSIKIQLSLQIIQMKCLSCCYENLIKWQLQI